MLVQNSKKPSVRWGQDQGDSSIHKCMGQVAELTLSYFCVTVHDCLYPTAY